MTHQNLWFRVHMLTSWGWRAHEVLAHGYTNSDTLHMALTHPYAGPREAHATLDWARESFRGRPMRFRVTWAHHGVRGSISFESYV